MTLAELAEESGIAARTIRFYIARGLVDGPVKAGRGAVYTSDHLERLERIKSLQAKGRMLAEIGHTLEGPASEPAAAATPWFQYAVADDVLIWVRADISPWRTKQIRAAVGELTRHLQKPEATRKE